MSKLLELCKTRVRKSSPDIFNFYIVSTGPDLVTDIAGLTQTGGNSKPKSLQTKRTKSGGHPENMGFNGNQFEGFPRMENEIHF